MHRWMGAAGVGLAVVLVVAVPATSDQHQQPEMHRVVAKPTFYLKPRPTAAPYDHLPDRPGKYVVVDLSDFRLYEMKDGWIVGQLPVSTGTGRYFSEYGHDGRLHTGVAVTPVGSYFADHGTAGMYHAPLGEMGWPVWLENANGDDPQGVAIHGENIAYHQNLSHGCIRIDWDAAPDFYDWIPQKAVVIVQQ